MYYGLLRVVVLIGFIEYCASSKCVFKQNRNSGLVVAKNFGFQKIILRHDLSDIDLEVDEVVDAFCDTGFRFCGKDMGNKIQIRCLINNVLRYKKPGMDEVHPDEFRRCDLQCDRSGVLQLYESQRKLANCEPHTSLALGISISAISEIYAGICYDWKTLELKYINYMAYKSQSMVVLDSGTSNRTDSGEFQVVTMDRQLPNFETYFKFMSKRFFMESYELLQRNHSLLELFTFDYESLMQDRPVANVFEPYTHLLNIIWWRNLRLGNWRTYLNLLEERSTAVKYNVTTGTGGVVVMPNVASACKTNDTLDIASEDNARRIAAPAYIWTHLTAVSANVTDDFVVIGYNSPFYTQQDSIIFCHDMCDEIDWLRRFGQIRLMPTMGLLFCCRPKDVAHKLDNFPHLAEEVADSRDDDEMTSTTPEYIQLIKLNT